MCDSDSDHKQKIFARRLSILLFVVCEMASCIYICIFPAPFDSGKSVIYPLLIGAYTALLGFVITASTSLLSTITQTSIRSAKLIFASSQGQLKTMLSAFSQSHSLLLSGIFIAASGLILDHSCVPQVLRAVYFGALLWNCLRVLSSVKYVIDELADLGNAIAGDVANSDTTVIEKYKHLTVDQFQKAIQKESNEVN